MPLPAADPSGGTGGFAVSPDQLGAMAASVGMVRQRTEALRPDLPLLAIEAAMPGTALAAATADTATAWALATRSLLGELTAVGQALTAAASSYQTTEAGIAAAIGAGIGGDVDGVAR